MSKSARWPILDATRHATEAVAAIKPYCDRIEVAGSIRRGRPDVGDIDLVVIPAVGNPWALTQIASALGGLGYGQNKAGQKIAAFIGPDLPNLDLYYANERTWGITLLVRTGSAAHNIKMSEHAQRANLPARALTLAGIVNTTKAVVASATEEECFRAIGLDYIEPSKREAPELEHRVKGDAE